MNPLTQQVQSHKTAEFKILICSSQLCLFMLKDFKAQIQENVVFTILAERGIGPQLFAVFPGGRIEEFLPVRRD